MKLLQFAFHFFIIYISFTENKYKNEYYRKIITGFFLYFYIGILVGYKNRIMLLSFVFQPIYEVGENARIVRLPHTHLRQVAKEPYEYSSAPRADEPEWDQLVKFVQRKVIFACSSTDY